MSYISNAKKITINTLNNMKQNLEKIAMLTCYDANFAKVLDKCNLDVILVGDSLGNVIQGHTTTIPVSIEAMVYHTACVNRACVKCFIISDMPFGSYDNEVTAYQNAVKLMQAGANMVKLEGGAWLANIIKYLTLRSIPVCAHLGLIPQSINILGNFTKQATTEHEAMQLEKDAVLLQEHGAQMLLFEAIPSELAGKITQQSKVPTIGIGAGKSCDGQVLVLYDVLGIFTAKPPSFSKNYLCAELANKSVEQAINNYISEVKNQLFP